MARLQPLAPVFSVMYKSPDPANLYAYTPGICALPGGRIIGTMDVGVKSPVSAALDGPVSWRKSNSMGCQGRVYVSDDDGASWRLVTYFPFIHARPFYAGNRLYVLGHLDDLYIIASDDEGETWTEPSRLTWGEEWGGNATNVYVKGNMVYFPFEKRRKLHMKKWVWATANAALMLLRGDATKDLTKRENWVFSDEFYFCDHVDMTKADYFGLPFYEERRFDMVEVAPGRGSAPVGWMECNVVEITDPDHLWFDPAGRTLHLLARCPSGRTNIGTILRMKETDDDCIVPEFVTTPAGGKWLFTPIPGGQMKFFIVQDDKTGLYWLISSQSYDSMIDPKKMPADRYSLPDNERHRLQLHFSRNCIDWCFAGIIENGATPLESRHYAAACIRGDDLLVLSRSGDKDSVNAHNCNTITLHKIENFRDLAY